MAPPQHLRRSSHPWRHVPALDGLRGVAVAAVVVFHLDARWLPGGYLGVDVFFVLSGFLITGLLLAELGRTGRVDLLGFWHRRALRLLPALLLVVAALTALLPGLDPIEQGRRVPELLAALGQVANWQLIHAGTGYFTEFSELSPLRHLWSLAVEFQFYLAWPFVVWLARSARRTGLVAAGGTAASIVAMVVLHDPGASDRAYFGTDTRVHQLLIGALAAVAVDRGVTLRRAPSSAGVAALLGIVALFWALPGTSSLYYRGGSVLVALLTAAVVMALYRGDDAIDRALAARPLVLLGQRSYSVYLAHWPVIVLVDADLVGVEGPALALAQVALSLVLAELSFRLVERPVRGGRPWGLELTPRRTSWLGSGALATTMVMVLVAGAGRQEAPPWVAEGGTSEISMAEGHRSPSNEGSEPRSSAGHDAEPERVALLGDSVAWSLATELGRVAEADGAVFGQATVIGCPIGPGPVFEEDGTPRSDNDECARAVAEAHLAVRAMDPTLVIWHDLNSTRARRSDEGTLLTGGSEWERSLFTAWDEAMTAIRGPETQVVMVVPPLRSQSALGACTEDPNPSRCEDLQRQDERIRAATRRYAAERAEPWLHVVNVDDLVCRSLPCPAVVDGVELRAGGADQTHFTDAGAKWLAPALYERAVRAAAGP